MEVWGGNAASENTVAMPGLDAWVYSRPYQGDSGGGDVHYVSSCATGRITRLLLADVSGHGQGVAPIAVTLRNLMRRYINFVDQSRLVRSMNEEFTNLAEMGTFATAVVATYWAPTSFLVTCNAGHPRPLLYRAATKTWELLIAPPPKPAPASRSLTDPPPEAPNALVNLPLGIADLTGYDQFGVKLQTGDLVLFYTDSITEAKDSSTGRLLGEAGLLRFAQLLDGSQPHGLIRRLNQLVLDFTGGAPSDDDLTVLLLRHNGVPLPSQTLQGLLAPFRIARSLVRRITGGRDSPAGLPEISIPVLGGAVIPSLGRRWKGK